MTDWIKAAQEHTYAAPGFAFADGSRMDLRLSYKKLGAPALDGGNTILLLHGTTGSGTQFLQPSMADYLFGAGQPLDAGKYFIILPDAIGHGKSSKPSDGKAQRFPRYCYADIVRAQHLLLTDGLKINHLRLVLGTSMGGMQTWMWGERHTTMMDALMPIASVPQRLSGRNLLWRRLLIEMIRSDPQAKDGSYTTQPRGVGLAWNLFKLMVDSPTHLADAFAGSDDADRHLRDIAQEALHSQDANDVIWEFDASRDYDPADRLGEIRAPLLAVNFADDELNETVLGTLENAITKVHRGRAITLPISPKSRGHQTLNCAEVWAHYVSELLNETETTQM